MLEVFNRRIPLRRQKQQPCVRVIKGEHHAHPAVHIHALHVLFRLPQVPQAQLTIRARGRSRRAQLVGGSETTIHPAQLHRLAPRMDLVVAREGETQSGSSPPAEIPPHVPDADGAGLRRHGKMNSIGRELHRQREFAVEGGQRLRNGGVCRAGSRIFAPAEAT